MQIKCKVKFRYTKNLKKSAVVKFVGKRYISIAQIPQTHSLCIMLTVYVTPLTAHFLRNMATVTSYVE